MFRFVPVGTVYALIFVYIRNYTSLWQVVVYSTQLNDNAINKGIKQTVMSVIWRFGSIKLVFKTPPLVFIEVSVPRHESEWSCIFALGVSILLLFKIFSVGFWNCFDSVVFFVFTYYCKLNAEFKMAKLLRNQHVNLKLACSWC